MTITEAQSGQIFTFYSYKGGTGRSMAVANFAYWLAKTFPLLTRRVLVMDWDLEAPGLHRYFAETAERTENQERPGIINYFGAIQGRLRAEPQLYERLEQEDGWSVLGEEFPLDEYLIPDVIAGVDFVKAGRYDAGYAEAISTFNWVDFYQQYGAVFPAFRDFLLRTYQFCLIDSRTGFNDVSGICTMLLPEKLITVFTPNRQNVSGVLDLAARAADYRLGSGDERTLSVFPLPSRIENAEQELRQVWQKDYQQDFEVTLKSIYKLDACDLTKYFDDVQLPHVSFYSYGEEIALLKEERSGALSLSRAYELFFEKLLRQKFAWDKNEDLAVVTAPAEAEVAEVVSKVPSTVFPDSDVSISDSRKDYDSDIYISYAHIDDQPVTGQEGWVSTFQRVLQTRLAQLLGESPKVWLDSKLRGNDIIDDRLGHHLARTNIFLAIVTPPYVRSPWCVRELREFYRHADKREGGSINNRGRLFKIVKTPIDEEELPEELKALLGYKFYEVDPKTGRPYEYSHEPAFESYQKFLIRLQDLAWDIKQWLTSQHPISHGLLASDAALDPTNIYLAEASPDLDFQRDTIRRELELRGYTVLPAGALPKEAYAFRENVRADLERCQLSIHPVGDTYGSIPNGEDRSAVEIQNELAGELSARVDFPRVIWIPVGLQPLDPRQRDFINRLRFDSNAQIGAELLETSLEDLKTFVHGWLMSASIKSRVPSALDLRAGGGPALIYMICDKQDFEATHQLTNYFFDQGFEVMLPLMEGDPAEVREDHKENLLYCDAVLIYYGNASEGWLRTKLRDLQKTAGYGRTKPMLAKGVYVGAPETSSKENYRTHEALVMKSFGSFSSAVLQPFLDAMNKAKKSYGT